MSKTKITTALERQIPEFIREDYETFVKFVKAYYEFLEQSQQRNLEDIHSIDRTLDEFVNKFRKELASLVPTSGLVNERVFLERIREFYNVRGSQESYKLLFRILFNKDVDVFYPSTQILRVSDGKWVQEKSIFVRQTDGNMFDLKGQIISIHTDKKTINVYCPNVIYYREDIYEVFIDKQYYTDISTGDHVQLQSADGHTHITGEAHGVILSCPAKYTITSKGSGFEAGTLYNLPTASGQGSTIKVTKVGSNGEIEKIQVISFGLDYQTNFYAKLSNKTHQALAFYHPITQYIAGTPRDPLLEPTATYGSPIENPPSADGISDYVNFGYFIRQDYLYYDISYIPNAYNSAYDQSDMLQTVWFVDTTYVGDIIAEFYTNEGGVIVDETTAEIKVELGPVAVYPGYYEKNDGFISDEIYIQDGNYYQLFSYVIRAEEQLENYKSVVKSLLHPAGLKLFGEYKIFTNHDIVATPLLAFIRRQFIDYLDAPVSGTPAFDITKPVETLFLSLSSGTSGIENLIKDVDKPLEDTAASVYVENEVKDVNKPLEDIGASVYVENEVKDLDKPASDLINSYAEDQIKDLVRPDVGDSLVSPDETVVKDVDKQGIDDILASVYTEDQIKDVGKVTNDDYTLDVLEDQIKDADKVHEDTTSTLDDQVKDTDKVTNDDYTLDTLEDQIKDVNKVHEDTTSTLDDQVKDTDKVTNDDYTLDVLETQIKDLDNAIGELYTLDTLESQTKDADKVTNDDYTLDVLESQTKDTDKVTNDDYTLDVLEDQIKDVNKVHEDTNVDLSESLIDDFSKDLSDSDVSILEIANNYITDLTKDGITDDAYLLDSDARDWEFTSDSGGTYYDIINSFADSLITDFAKSDISDLISTPTDAYGSDFTQSQINDIILSSSITDLFAFELPAKDFVDLINSLIDSGALYYNTYDIPTLEGDGYFASDYAASTTPIIF